MRKNQPFTFYEFFAGGGMVRAGLGRNWQCLFANDIDAKKSAAYLTNWGDRELVTKDVRDIDTDDLPGDPDLVWASFPCQDLSLAGKGAGLNGQRSGVFWPFWRLFRKLNARNRKPRILVLENVCGALTSHGGLDFAAIAAAFAKENYRFGALVMDASGFVPQSRPRLFIVAVPARTPLDPALIGTGPNPHWRTKALCSAHARLPDRTQGFWIWWNIPTPTPRTLQLADVIETGGTDFPWHTPHETARLLEMMSPANEAKVKAAGLAGYPSYGAIYRRTRTDESGRRMQRAEVRFDGMAGCLRTPAGGSSRQVIVVVEGETVRSRLISSREAARLMGLPDQYKLPANYNDAYHLAGDGVVVPVVRHLAKHLLEKILNFSSREIDERAIATSRDSSIGIPRS